MRHNAGLTCRTVRPIFGRPGGKSRTACQIVRFFPSHERYVEPFVGGGSILVAKSLSKQEIVADADPRVVRLFRAAKEGVKCNRTVPSQAAERSLIAGESRDPCDEIS